MYRKPARPGSCGTGEPSVIHVRCGAGAAAFPAAIPCTPEVAAQRRNKLDALRAHIREIEFGDSRTAPMQATMMDAVPLGIEAIDRALPWGGLLRGALHAITAGAAGICEDGGSLAPDSASSHFGKSRIASEAVAMATGAATGFAAALVGKLCGRRGRALWCLRRGDLYAPGLSAFGVDPARLMMVRAKRPEDVLWTLEEALGCGRFAAVLGEGAAADLTAGRRLQLVARRRGTACLLLDRGDVTGGGANAVMTRWHIAAVPGTRSPGGGPMTAGWRVTLARCRGGAVPRHWTVEWCYEARDFAVAAPLADRSSISA